MSECIVCFQDLATAGPGNPYTLQPTVLGWVPVHDTHTAADVRDALAFIGGDVPDEY